MVEINKYAALDSQTKFRLEAFIEAEFGHIPIVQQTEWARPDWTIIYYQQGEIASFYNIVEREIFLDDQAVHIAGINNVITPKNFRGKGFASQVLKETAPFIFDELQAAFGLLLCADALIPFYERLGWYTLDCPVYFLQSTGENRWAANTMLLSKKEKVTPQRIHLNGLPW